MKKYETEYLIHKEQEAQLEDPVERLQVTTPNFSLLPFARATRHLIHSYDTSCLATGNGQKDN